MSARLYLLIILLVSFLIKLPFLTAPLLGHFGSYQVVNAMMAEMMLEGQLSDFFTPRTGLIVGGEPALHLLYYPFGSLFSAIGHLIIGWGIDFGGRFQAAFFMLLSSFMVYRIGTRLFEKVAALIAVLIFSLIPMNLVLGISFQNEAFALAALLGSFYLVLRNSFLSAAGAGVLFSMALIARIHFITLLPVFFLIYVFQHRSLIRGFSFCVNAIVPLAAWYGFLWVLQNMSPENVQTSLFRQAGDGRLLKESLLLSPSFYKRLIEILAGQWLTPVLLPFLFFTFSWKSAWEKWLSLWVLCALGTIVLLPQKVYDHPFYLVHALPAVSLLLGILAARWRHRMYLWKGMLLLCLFFAFSMRFYLPPALSPYKESVDVVKVGNEIDKLLPRDALIITQHGSSPDLLYYSNRLGWAFDIGSGTAEAKLIENLEAKRGQGARFLVISQIPLLENHREFTSYLDSKYVKIPGSSSSTLIYDLQ